MCCISCSSSRKLLMISTIYKAPSALPFRYAAVWIRLYIRVWDVREQSRFLENIVWFSSQPSHCRRWFNSNPLRLSILDCYFQNSWNSRIWTFLNNFIMRLRLWIWTIYLVGLDVLCHRILLLTGSFMSIWTVLIEIPSFRRSWVVAVGGLWKTTVASAFGCACHGVQPFKDLILTTIYPFRWRKQRGPLTVSCLQDFCACRLVDLWS